MGKSIIYYTNNKLEEPIFTTVQKYILQSGLPIVSCSLKPTNFGTNFVLLDQESGYLSMIRQIITCLENSYSDYVFFCEHDVLYPKSHFEFTPPSDSLYYYNDNVWRWYFKSDHAITYPRLFSLSSLCVNRKLVLNNYRMRMEKIYEHIDEFNSHEPSLARKWGYEPGTKKRKRGGLTDEDFATWKSKEPIIDIRHSNTFSPPKVTLESFKHKPPDWTEITIGDIPYWNLKEIFS